MGGSVRLLLCTLSLAAVCCRPVNGAECHVGCGVPGVEDVPGCEFRPFGGAAFVRSRLAGVHVAAVGPTATMEMVQTLMQDMGGACTSPSSTGRHNLTGASLRLSPEHHLWCRDSSPFGANVTFAWWGSASDSSRPAQADRDAPDRHRGATSAPANSADIARRLEEGLREAAGTDSPELVVDELLVGPFVDGDDACEHFVPESEAESDGLQARMSQLLQAVERVALAAGAPVANCDHHASDPGLDGMASVAGRLVEHPESESASSSSSSSCPSPGAKARGACSSTTGSSLRFRRPILLTHVHLGDALSECPVLTRTGRWSSPDPYSQPVSEKGDRGHASGGVDGSSESYTPSRRVSVSRAALLAAHSLGWRVAYLGPLDHAVPLQACTSSGDEARDANLGVPLAASTSAGSVESSSQSGLPSLPPLGSPARRVGHPRWSLRVRAQRVLRLLFGGTKRIPHPQVQVDSNSQAGAWAELESESESSRHMDIITGTGKQRTYHALAEHCEMIFGSPAQVGDDGDSCKYDCDAQPEVAVTVTVSRWTPC